MEQHEFWALIDLARTTADGNVDDQIDLISRWLAERSVSDVASFHRHLVAASEAIHTRSHAAAGEIPLGGLSDDAFLDFRLWTIAQGRLAYDRFHADPDSLADLEEPWSGEPLAYVAEEIIEEADPSGEELPSLFPDGAPTGDPSWSDGGVARQRLPRLAARYG